MRILEELTIKEVVEMCYNTKYCTDCELRQFCNDEIVNTPSNWEIKAYTKMAIGPITAEEVQDDQRA